MINIRRSNERGGGDYGWLNTRHTFSFDQYHDPRFMGFRSLRVINEDRVAPGEGFPTHPHRDMEIITYILEGALEHKDSLGTGSVIRPGDGQRMSAGRGIRHSEMNSSPTEAAHLLQIWIMPDRSGHEPSYEQKAFPDEEKRGKLRQIAGPDGKDGSVTIHQDARLYVTLLVSRAASHPRTGEGPLRMAAGRQGSGGAERKAAQTGRRRRRERRAKAGHQRHRRRRSPAVRSGMKCLATDLRGFKRAH